MKNRPPYSISSVDHALRLAALLQHEGSLRVTDAADRLGVSASTAHRLLTMLVYWDFAERTPDRRYGPGKMLRRVELSEAPITLLRRVALPHLRRLVNQTGESANVVVLAGTEAHFVATVESEHVLRVGDRDGRSLPAHRTSGGKAILAALPLRDLTKLLANSSEVDLARLRRELSQVRKRGFAINDQLTETGLTAVGIAVRDRSGTPVAGVSLALPTARFDRDLLPTWVAALYRAVSGIESAMRSNVSC